MAEHLWTILCSKALLDPSTQNLYLMEVLEELQVNGLDALPPPPAGEPNALAGSWHLVTMWRRTNPEVPERFSQRLTIIGPRGAALGPPFASEVDLTVASRFRSMGTIVGLPVDGYGTYVLRVERQLANQEWARVEPELQLIVSRIREPQAAPA